MKAHSLRVMQSRPLAMGRLWLVAVTAAVSIACSAVIGAEGKRSKTLEDISPFQAAALGNMPTCCPRSPKLYCDFVFDGYDHSIPVYHLNDGLNMDHPLSPSLAKTLGWIGWLGHFSPGVKDSRTGQLVSVASTYQNGSFLQCPRVLPKWIGPDNQFYIASSSDSPVGKLFTRAFQSATAHQHGRHFYEGRCILLPLTSLSIPTAQGNINLDFGDGRMDYPESRRCVVFRTAK